MKISVGAVVEPLVIFSTEGKYVSNAEGMFANHAALMTQQSRVTFVFHASKKSKLHFFYIISFFLHFFFSLFLTDIFFENWLKYDI